MVSSCLAHLRVNCCRSCATRCSSAADKLSLAQRQRFFSGAGGNGRPVHDGAEVGEGGAVGVEARAVGIGIDSAAQEARSQEELSIAAVLGGLRLGLF